MDPYKILGVKKNATNNEIKDRYRELSKKHHPDKGGDPEVFAELAEAWEILGDEDKRKQYDEFGVVATEEKLQRKAEALLQQAFQTLVAQSGMEGILCLDVIAALKDLLDRGIGELQNKRTEAEKNIRDAKKVNAKFTCKAKKNLIGAMFQNDINKNQGVITQCNLEEVVAKRTYEMIDDYMYDADEAGFIHTPFKAFVRNFSIPNTQNQAYTGGGM